MLEDVQQALVGMLKPEFEEVVTGDAEVREVFSIPRVGKVAGCYVQNGVITRGSRVRFLRDGVVIWNGQISSLKRFKDDVREVQPGFECGIGLERLPGPQVRRRHRDLRAQGNRPHLRCGSGRRFRSSALSCWPSAPARAPYGAQTPEGPTDVCALLTVDEAAKTLGQPVGEGTPSTRELPGTQGTRDSCTWETQQADTGILSGTRLQLVASLQSNCANPDPKACFTADKRVAQGKHEEKDLKKIGGHEAFYEYTGEVEVLVGPADPQRPLQQLQHEHVQPEELRAPHRRRGQTRREAALAVPAPRARDALGMPVPPSWLARAVSRARDALGLGRRKLAPPFIVTLEHLQGMIDNKALAVAVELEIPDQLHGGAKRADDLARDIGADADALNRLLRFLVSRGLLGMTSDGRYRNNAVSDTLRRDHPWSARNWVLFFGGDWHWKIWNEAKHSFLTGESAARAATGHEFFEYVNEVDAEAGRRSTAR